MNHNIPDDYVKMSTKLCPICGVYHQHNAEILIHKNFRSIKGDPETGEVITGMGLCKEHSEKEEEYIALISVDPKQSNISENGAIKMEDACRTGNYMHMRRTVFPNVLDSPTPDLPFIFIEEEAFNKIVEMYNNR